MDKADPYDRRYDGIAYAFFAAIVLTGMWGYPGAAAASPLAWIGSVAVLLYSYMRSMKQLKHMGEEEHFTLEHAEAR